MDLFWVVRGSFLRSSCMVELVGLGSFGEGWLFVVGGALGADVEGGVGVELVICRCGRMARGFGAG
jgi:hypothetical protein